MTLPTTQPNRLPSPSMLIGLVLGGMVVAVLPWGIHQAGHRPCAECDARAEQGAIRVLQALEQQRLQRQQQAQGQAPQRVPQTAAIAPVNTTGGGR